MIIYRLDVSDVPVLTPLTAGIFFVVNHPIQSARYFPAWVRSQGLGQALKTALKVMSGKRLFYGVMHNGKVVQSGWANLGFCRYYAVEKDSIVLGTLWTMPEYRNRGLATAAKSRLIAFLYKQGFRRFYADTTPQNVAARRTIEKLGFQEMAFT